MNAPNSDLVHRPERTVRDQYPRDDEPLATYQQMSYRYMFSGKGLQQTRFRQHSRWQTHWQVAIMPATYRFIWRLRTKVGDVCPFVDDQGDLSG